MEEEVEDGLLVDDWRLATDGNGERHFVVEQVLAEEEGGDDVQQKEEEEEEEELDADDSIDGNRS